MIQYDDNLDEEETIVLPNEEGPGDDDWIGYAGDDSYSYKDENYDYADDDILDPDDLTPDDDCV